jgi:putative ABC transport system permease protein
MMHSLYLAWRYLQFHSGKTVVLIAVLTLVTYLPLAVHMLVRASEAHLLARAQTTPFVIGQKGSALDLVLHTLYFTTASPALTSMAEAQRIDDSGLATAIPLYTRFKARGHPIVGTTLDYFAYRHLTLQAGRPLALLGECVLGAKVAETLGLHPGDGLISSPENLFDLAGSYPLKMHVVGVLHATHTADDLAVFVDITTAWVIAGLGHGHEKLTTTTDPQVLLAQETSHVVANAQLRHYTEITPDNLETFHFHGEPSHFPLTALIAIPHDDKAAVLLMGRYHTDTSPTHMVQPSQVVDALVRHLWQIRYVFDATFAVVSVAMLLAMALIIALSLRLRQPEILTIFHLGCSRLKVVELLAAEIGLIILISLALTTGLALATTYWHGTLMHWLLVVVAGDAQYTLVAGNVIGYFDLESVIVQQPV